MHSPFRYAICILGAAGMLLTAACKPRNPDEGGLLQSDDELTAPVQSEVKPGGDFHLSCQPADGDPDHATYTFEVTGAVSEQDESQDVLVTVAKSESGGKPSVLGSKLEGHGAISVSGPVFVGFPLGVLTADPAPRGQSAHPGVLTLAGDPKADGLKVSCLVQKTGA
jgi:hypothetical protein